MIDSKMTDSIFITQWKRHNSELKSSSSATGSRNYLLEQASKFLQDKSVRDAPNEQKIAFLDSKGLKMDEIGKLLGISDNATSSISEEFKLKSSQAILLLTVIEEQNLTHMIL